MLRLGSVIFNRNNNGENHGYITIPTLPEEYLDQKARGNTRCDTLLTVEIVVFLISAEIVDAFSGVGLYMKIVHIGQIARLVGIVEIVGFIGRGDGDGDGERVWGVCGIWDTGFWVFGI